ncbi:MAG: hypothetical protein R2838_16585 [Caldilineaceae bacterium]
MQDFRRFPKCYLDAISFDKSMVGLRLDRDGPRRCPPRGWRWARAFSGSWTTPWDSVAAAIQDAGFAMPMMPARPTSQSGCGRTQARRGA